MRKDYSLALSVFEHCSLGDDKCWYCGIQLSNNTKSKDHFWPKSMGGRLKVACCKNCNGMKKNLTPKEFIRHLKYMKGKHPDHAPWQKKFDRMIHSTMSLWNRVEWSMKAGDLHNGHDYNEIVCDKCGSVISIEL